MTDTRKHLEESIRVKEAILRDEALLAAVAVAATAMVDALRHGGRVLFCGNGGSAADAQHLAAELAGRFLLDRSPLDAEALHVNTSYLTAVANDYGFDEVYSRIVRARGRKGDVLVALSTSGTSTNVLAALDEAERIGMIRIGLTGASGGVMSQRTDHLIRVPSTDTPHIQEAHITLGHVMCGMVEEALFGGTPSL